MAKVVIIGGVAGGMSCAARLRRLNESFEITVLEKGPYISFANCGLPYHIGGTIAEREKLLLLEPAFFENRFKATVKTNTEALSIDRKAKKVEIMDVKTGKKSFLPYDYVVLSPGAQPFVPPVPGVDLDRIFTLRNVPDTDKVNEFIENHNPKSAVVIGGGFIGLEMAENLVDRGIEVSLVELANQVMTPLDFEMASVVHEHLRMKGVNLYLSKGVQKFEMKGHKLEMMLSDSSTITADFAMLSIGIRPDNKLAKDAGLKVGERGGIVVNEYLQTSDETIFAAGDAIEVQNMLLKKPVLVPLGGPANKQGRTVADNIVNTKSRKYNGAIGTGIAKVFDLTVASTGLNAKTLAREEMPYQEVVIHPNSHAGYYPNPLPMTVKMTFDPKSGRVLGAQIVGYEGVDKRIDVMALAIAHSMTVNDLTEFEQAYAPPFNSAKDPVNMIGFVAQNIIEGKWAPISWNELECLTDDVLKIDVRTPEEVGVHAMPGFVNIPLDELRGRLSEIPKGKDIVVTCAVGLRGYIAARILTENGYQKVRNLTGGAKTYFAATAETKVAKCSGELKGEKTVAKSEVRSSDIKINTYMDATGLQCPGPIMKAKSAMDQLNDGEVVEIKATDMGFYNDVKSFARATGNELLELENENGVIRAVLQKGSGKKAPATNVENDEVTLVVFDDDLDRVIASLIIANGAIAMGKKANIFFTFWGLNVLKKKKKVRGLKKNLIEKMFSAMLPRGTKKLSLSQMNFAGIGPKMIRGLMKKKGVSSVEEMLQELIDGGGNLIACQMSMDLMGVRREELMDGIAYGGVANYLEHAFTSSPTLFI